MAATTAARRETTPQTLNIPNPPNLLKEQPPPPHDEPIHHDHDHHHHHAPANSPPPDVVGFVFDGEDLIFSDDIDVELEAAFPSLPDFKCLSSSPSSNSPNGSANIQPRKSVVTTSSSSSSSSSSSLSSTSSNWPFLRSPDAVPGSLPACSSDMSMQPQHPSDPHPLDERDAQLGVEELLVGGDGAGGGGGSGSAGVGTSVVDGYNFSVPWDSDELFPLTLDESGACSSDQTFNLDQLCPGFDETNSGGGTAAEGEDRNEESDDLAKFFLEWLKNNKDAISPEDLRSIRLKKSTIECAARRLGPDRRGRMQLVKLILSWVQNHHLQRKKARLQEAGLPHANSWFNRAQPIFNQASVDSVAPNPNPNLDFDTSQATNNWCNPWLPTSDPYNFQQSCTGSSPVVNGQLYSLISDLHAPDPNMSWDPSYNAAFAGYPLTYPAGLQATQFGAGPIGPLYHQGQSMPNMASATKEARRKRMARQRRLMSVQQSRVSGQGDNPIGQGNGSDRNWAFWSSAVNTHQGNGMVDLNLLPAGSMFGSGQHEHVFLRQGGSAASEKRQGFKSYERNLRFLLQKVLKQSDVGSLGRIVLPKKEAEIHLPELDSRDGITIPMEDIATSRVWNMHYRFWPNNKSRMYLLENTGDFVRSNRLEEGDFIVIYSDVKSGKYMIRGVKVKPSPEKGRILTKVEELKRTSSERSREDSSASSSLNLSSNKVKTVIKC